MKTLILLSFCVTVFAYSDISINEHFENVLKKPEELKKQLYCYLDRGPCSELAEHHKRHILEAVNDRCSHCTASHKHNIRLFIKAAKEQYPDLFAEFRRKYDPDGKHYDYLINEVAKS